MKFTATVTRDTRPSSPSYLASSPLLFYPNATSQDFAQDRLVSGQNVKHLDATITSLYDLVQLYFFLRCYV